MASPLLLCTTDLLRLVFQLLSRDALYAVCLVNKDLRALAEPFLYFNVQWIYRSFKSPTLPVNLLLRSILRRPELAAYVKKLSIDGRQDFYKEDPRIIVTEDELDEPIRLVEMMRVPYGYDWIQGLRQGTMTAFFTLLVSRLPNLTCLHLGRDFTQRGKLLGMMFMSCLSGSDSSHRTLPTFEYLKDVYLPYSARKTKIRHGIEVKNTTELLSIFYLPSIQRVSVTIDSPIAFSWPFPKPPDPAQLKALKLYHIREGHLEKFLSTMRALKTLRWDWVYRSTLKDDVINIPVMNLDQIVADLSHVRDTLTDLTITADIFISKSETESPTVEIKGSLEGIVDFDGLKRMRIPVPFLVGFSINPSKRLADVLPRNIEFLTITDDLFLIRQYEWHDVDILGIIGTWLQDWKTSTPNLQGFHLFVQEVNDEWGPTMRQQLRELCTGAGVQVEITKDHD